MTNVTVERKGVLSSREIGNMLRQADKLNHEYFRLRAKAVVSLFKTGKRRAEVANLECSDIRLEKEYVYITFTVVKKRKKSVLATQRTKRFSLNSRYADHILNYWKYMKEHHNECQFLFPSIRAVFGIGYAFSRNRHLSGRQVLRIIKQLNPKAWCHLFRETRGAEVVREDEKRTGEASILTVYRVKRALDLEKETTAWNYINRYATETLEFEEEGEESLSAE